MNPAQPLLDVCQTEPTRLAVVELGGRSIDRVTLTKRIYGVALLLRQQGIKKGDRVLIQVPPGIDLTISILAVMWIGGIVVLLEGGVGDSVYVNRVEKVQPKWLIVHSTLLWIHRIPGVRTLLSWFEIAVPALPRFGELQQLQLTPAMLKTEAEASPAVDFHPEEDVLIVFTGGTTKAPKCVRYAAGAIEHFLQHIHYVIGHREIQSFLADTPPQVLYALKMGYTAYVNKGQKKKRALSMLRLVESGVIDACFTSPYLWMELIRSNRLTTLPASLHTILLGSAPITRDFLRQLQNFTAENTSIFCIYGMTEVGVIGHIEASDKVAWRGTGDIVGKIVDGVTVELKDVHPQTKVGEICVHSPSLYSGYIDHPTRKKEAPLQTGDLGKWTQINDQKMLVLAGRIKDMIIRNGFNLYPQTYETQITEAICQKAGSQLIQQCAMIGVWNAERADEDVILFVEWSSKKDRKESKWLLAVSAEVCGIQAKPDHCFGLDEFPVTGRQNKLDKRALQHQAALLLNRDPAEGYQHG